MTPTELADIERLRELADADREWFLVPRPTNSGLSQIEDGRQGGMFPVTGETHEINLIIAMHNAWPAIVTTLRASTDRALTCPSEAAVHIAAEIAPDLDRLIDDCLHGENPDFEKLENFLWDNKVGLLRIAQALALSPKGGEPTTTPWQPIESAPVDGSDFLACLGDTGDMMVIFYDEPSDDAPTHCWHRMDGLAYHRDLPTHWMPLPAVPAERLCPRPVNSRPENVTVTVSDCVKAGECGCDLGTAITSGEPCR